MDNRGGTANYSIVTFRQNASWNWNVDGGNIGWRGSNYDCTGGVGSVA